MPDARQSKTQFIIEIYTENDMNEALTNSYTTFRIVNSIDTCWPVFQIYFDIDNQTIIEKNIYGQNDITVKVWTTGEAGEKLDEPVTYTLLYLQSNLDLPPKMQDNISNRRESQRRKIMIEFLAKPSFLTMTQHINKLWEEETNLTPYELITELCDSREIPTDYVSDKNINESLVGQFLIPPMTLKSAIDFIDDKLGVYAGPIFRYANYAGQLLMWDLKQKYEDQKDLGFTKYHKMPAWASDDRLFADVQQEISAFPDQFLTYDDAHTIHSANSHIIKYGYQNIRIIHPHEDIIHMEKSDINELNEELGFWHENNELKIHPELSHRKLYHIDSKGFETGSGYSGEYSDYAFKNKLSSNIMDASMIRFRMYRNIKMSYCQKIGETMYLRPYSEHELFRGSNYEGAYILTHSDIVFSKIKDGEQRDNVDCNVTLTGVRSVQTKD